VVDTGVDIGVNSIVRDDTVGLSTTAAVVGSVV
jgi:hypothetical protein